MHAEQIKAEMRIAGQSPAMVAAELGVTRSTMSQVIHGRTTSHRVQSRIAAILDKAVSEIWEPKKTLNRKAAA